MTGAGSGLGREVGRYFAGQGWFVGITDGNSRNRRDDPRPATIYSQFGRCHHPQLNLRSEITVSA